MACLSTGNRNLAAHETRSIADVYKSYTYFQDGDVLLAKITPCFENGKLGVARELKSGIGFGSSEFFVIRPGNQILSNYIYYYLDQQCFRDAGKRVMTGAVGHKRVPREFLEALPTPLPPLEEQRRIVAVLDEAFEGLDRARAHAEANLAATTELATRCLDCRLTRLHAQAGRISLSEIATVKGGKRLPKGEKTTSKRTPFPYITVRDMTDDGTIPPDKLGYISREVQRSISRYTISSHDVYVSIAGTIGKSGIIPDSLDGANLTENAAKLVLFDGWKKEFVYWCTRSTDFGKQVVQQTRVAAQPKLALQRLGAITIPNAAPEQQAELACRMAEVRATDAQLAKAYRQKLGHFADLRESILLRAFAGELT